MKCRKCGAELDDGVLFCRECGTKVVFNEKPESVLENNSVPEDNKKGSGVKLLKILEKRVT